MDPIERLKNRLAAIAAGVRAIELKAEQEERLLTGEENEAIDKLQAEFTATEKEIAKREASAELQAKVNKATRITQPADVDVENSGRPRITGGDKPGASKGTFGFSHMGEWAAAARQGSISRGKDLDDRIRNAPSTFGSEGVNSDGGFAVPPDFRTNIQTVVMGEESLLGRCDQQPTQSNELVLPQDAVAPWDDASGPVVYAVAEGADITPSKPDIKQLTIRAHKYAALIPMTEELLQDSVAMNAYLNRKVPEKFAFRLNNDLVVGTGVGTLQGLLNAPGKITQAAESGQGANTVVAKNILKMWGRMYSEFRKNAVWLANQDVEQQLQQLVMPGTNPSMPAYMPPGGFSQSPFATLLGRPVVITEACKALGTEGDLVLTDLKQYCLLTKAGGLRADVSIHLYFNSDHTAFRFIMRVGGQSYLPGAISRKNGSNTLSSIVTLNSTRT